MPFRYDIYVGSENGTRRISPSYLSRVEAWASRTFPKGYALFRGRGLYNRSPEDSILVSIVSNHELDLVRKLDELKRELEQESVLLAKSEVEVKMI